MDCNNTIINSELISSNNETSQSLPILSGLADKSCYLRLADSVYIYDKMNVTVKSQIPSSISFTPLETYTYYAGSNVSLGLISTPEAGNFMVQLTCGNLDPVTRVISSNTTAQNFTIPKNFYGLNCIFNVSYPIAVSNPSSIVVIGGNLTIIKPQNGSRIAAGTETEVEITTSPIVDFPISVQLDCGEDMQTNAFILPNTQVTQYFPVPQNFYGTACMFKVVKFPFADPVNVTITQELTFSSPENSSIIYRPDPIPIVMTPGYLDIIEPVTLELHCTSLVSIDTFTDVILDYEYTSDFYGSCELSIKNAPGYFEIGSKLQFSLKDQLFFAQDPSFIVNGLDFTVQIDTVSAPIPGDDTVDLGLYCNGIDEVLGWTDVPLNEPVLLNLNDPIFTSGPYKCYFKIEPNEVYEEISSNVLVLIQLTPEELDQFITKCGLNSNSLWF